MIAFSAQAVRLTDDDATTGLEADIIDGLAAEVQPNDAIDSDADTEVAPTTGLAQVDDILAELPVPNAEVDSWLESLRADKWNQLAENPPIELTANNVTLTTTARV